MRPYADRAVQRQALMIVYIANTTWLSRTTKKPSPPEAFVSLDYKPENNCGCVVAMLVIAPFAVFWLLINTLGGFGCEAAGRDCTPTYGPFFKGVAVLVLAGAGIAWLINAIKRNSRDR